MKSSAKVKSFHVAVRGNFPAACDFAEPDTCTTTRRRAVGNESTSSAESSPESAQHHRNNLRNHHLNRLNIIGMISGITHHLNRRTINGPPTGDPDIESLTFPQRAIRRASCRHGPEGSIERAVATEPRAIRRASCRHGAANDPTPKPYR